MSNGNSLIVHAAGRQLDALRQEATRLAKVNNGCGWWIERAEVGSRFWFEEAKATEDFAQSCESVGVRCEPDRAAQENEHYGSHTQPA